MGFTWNEDVNAMDIPVLNQKEESSDSEEEEDPQSKVLCLVFLAQEASRGGCNVIYMSVCPVAKPSNPREHL